MGSGDACVALDGEEWRSWEKDEGDASVPSPRLIHSIDSNIIGKGVAKRAKKKENPFKSS